MRLIAALLLVFASMHGAAAAFETVQIAGPDQITLRSVLYKPSGEGPFPVIVALHGRAGLGNRSDSIQPRYQEWAKA